MNLLVMSDLHLEWHRDFGVSFIESLDPTGVDVLVLAGDIADAKDARDILGMLCAKFAEVAYLHGNHELYGHSPEQAKGYIHRAKNKNLHWLNNSSATINGVRFVGATLWFPKPSTSAYKGGYNDFSQIHGFEPWVYDEHRAALDFLRAELRPEDVLVTHFIPLRESIHPMYAGHPLNCFFWSGSEADQIVRERGPRLVAHGHTHTSIDQVVGTSRVVCNPFGYVRVGQNPKFDERFIVSV